MGVVINEVCGTGVSKTKNTGGKKQCLEGAVQTYALAKSGFKFPDLESAKSKVAWDLAKKNKDIVVFYDIEELEPNNTEAQIKNGRFSDYKISAAKKGVNYTHYLSTCSYEAVKSYEDSDYTRIFRITEKNELLCEAQEDGSIKGEPLKSFIVGIRDDAPADGTPSVKLNFKFDNYSMSIIEPDFDMTSYEGIYDVKLSLVLATASSIQLKANQDCNGEIVPIFEDGDFIVKDTMGAVQTIGFVPLSPDNIYELTGTAFATGFTVELNGVIVTTDRTYEGVNKLNIIV